MDNKEEVILKQILSNITFCRKTIMYLEADYFDTKLTKTLFDILKKHFIEYDSIIDKSILVVESSKRKNINDEEQSELIKMYELFTYETTFTDEEWFLKFAEDFCKERAVYNAVQDSIVLMENEKNIDSLPFLFEKAVGISFDVSIGHDLQEDARSRIQSYRQKVDKLSTGFKDFDYAMGGGFERKTLNSILAGTGVGKTLAMVSFGSNFIRQGLKVAYFTFEMAEEKITQRFDANLLNTDIDDLKSMEDDVFVTKLNAILNRSQGQLKVKEFPTSGANVNHIKATLQDWKHKSGFVPDAIFIDYINIMNSARVNHNSGSYTIIKSIAEELRGLAVTTNTCIITATQSVRGSQESSDIALSDTSESFGLPATLDFFIGILQTPELQEAGQFLIKQLKSRYGDINKKLFWTMGVNKARMTMYDVIGEDYEINKKVEQIQSMSKANLPNVSEKKGNLKF